MRITRMSKWVKYWAYTLSSSFKVSTQHTHTSICYQLFVFNSWRGEWTFSLTFSKCARLYACVHIFVLICFCCWWWFARTHIYACVCVLTWVVLFRDVVVLSWRLQNRTKKYIHTLIWPLHRSTSFVVLMAWLYTI